MPVVLASYFIMRKSKEDGRLAIRRVLHGDDVTEKVDEVLFMYLTGVLHMETLGQHSWFKEPGRIGLQGSPRHRGYLDALSATWGITLDGKKDQ